MEKDVIDYFSYLPKKLQKRLLDALEQNEEVKLPCTADFWSNIPRTEIVALYGVGDGDYFTLAKRWLDWRPEHSLIIIEDDFKILAQFLRTEVAKEILAHPKVLLVAYDEKEMNLGDVIVGSPFVFMRSTPLLNSEVASEMNLDGNIESSSYVFMSNTWLSCQAVAAYRNRPTFQKISHALHTAMDECSVQRSYFAYSKFPFENALHNALYASHAVDLSYLRGVFRGIPAIICGAGASLEGEIEQLKTLYDRAMIFAGGTAIQILDQVGVSHHLNVGIDPNFATVAKIMQQTSFETPFIYSDRVAKEGFTLLQGPLIFAAMGMGIESYFNAAFGSLSYPGLEHSVSIGAISVAEFLGCSPLILVGQDFCLVKERKHAFGVQDHPLLTEDERYKATSFTQYIVQAQNGKEYKITAQFSREISWLAAWLTVYPHLNLVNCSMDGYPVPLLRQIPLSEVLKTECLVKKDMQGLLHAELMQLPKRATEKSRDETFESWTLSCDKVQEILSTEHPEPALYFEVAYKYCLKIIDYWLSVHQKNREKYWKMTTIPSFDRFAILKEWARILTETALAAKREAPQDVLAGQYKRAPQIGELPVVEGAEEKIERYPNGTVKSRHYLLDGELEGPSQFFSSEGVLLSYANFRRGKREEVALRFYATGSLYAKENYEKGVLQGLQHYYYQDGRTKTLLDYKNGALDGRVLLYFPDGQLKREMHFKEGVREDVERVWNAKGKLLIEQHYVNGKATGVGKMWNAEGHLILEKEF